jgi:hypothetical protein
MELSKEELSTECKRLFEDAYLAIPDSDETLLSVDEDGNYIDGFIESLYYTYHKGFNDAITCYKILSI